MPTSFTNYQPFFNNPKFWSLANFHPFPSSIQVKKICTWQNILPYHQIFDWYSEIYFKNILFTWKKTFRKGLFKFTCSSFMFICSWISNVVVGSLRKRTRGIVKGQTCINHTFIVMQRWHLMNWLNMNKGMTIFLKTQSTKDSTYK